MKARTFADVSSQVTIPEDGTISRTLYEDEKSKTVLFGFSAGQELSEHTASVPAILHFLEGEASVTLGTEVVDARPGTWVHMPAKLPHSIAAKTEVRMLLTLIR